MPHTSNITRTHTYTHHTHLHTNTFWHTGADQACCTVPVCIQNLGWGGRRPRPEAEHFAKLRSAVRVPLCTYTKWVQPPAVAHWKALPSNYSPCGRLRGSASIGWCRLQNDSLTWSMLIVSSLSAFYLYFLVSRLLYALGMLPLRKAPFALGQVDCS